MRFSVSLSFLLFFCFFIEGSVAVAQHSKKDSLLRVIKISPNDSNKLNAIYALGEIVSMTNMDSALLITEQALVLAEHLPGFNGDEPDKTASDYDSIRCQIKLSQLSKANYFLGTGYSAKREYRKALGYQIKALAWSQKMVHDPNQGAIDLELGYVYWNLSNYTKAIEYDTAGLRLAEKQHDNTMIATIAGNLGVVYGDQGNYTLALGAYARVLKTVEELKDTNRIALVYGNIGFVYWNKGDYLKALDYDFKALRLDDKMGNKPLSALMLCNIGVVYWNQKNYDRALEYSRKALRQEQQLDNKYRIALNLGNISNIYRDQKNNTLALGYAFWSLSIRRELDDKKGLSVCYGNIAANYLMMGDSVWKAGNKSYALEEDYPLVLSYASKALALAERIGDKVGCANWRSNIGHVLIRQGKYSEARKSLEDALVIADSIGALEPQKSAHWELSDLFYKTKDYKNAYEHQKAGMILTDSLLSKDKTLDAERKSMSYEYERKEFVMKSEQEKKEAAAAAQKQKQRIILYSVSAVLLLVISLAVLIYRNSLQKQKANLMLERKNHIIEKQKNLVEKKNQHILESINYAKRIQDAILPENLFEPGEVFDHFVYFSPKDIVSGDFYWRFKEGDEVFFAVVDCTGHGVPGAMMSMLGYDMLEYAVKDQQLRDPARIIQSVNEQMLDKLVKDNPGRTKDGMDLTLCRYNRKSRMLTFAGAKNELLVVLPGEMVTYTVDKRSIGDQPGFDFSQKQIILEPGATLYLFTDGYPDQKGGPENKKYMNTRFRTLLQKVSNLGCAEQRQKLNEEFQSWKGESHQRDDVLIVGVKV